jgi:hypothetical protein
VVEELSFSRLEKRPAPIKPQQEQKGRLQITRSCGETPTARLDAGEKFGIHAAIIFLDRLLARRLRPRTAGTPGMLRIAYL